MYTHLGLLLVHLAAGVAEVPRESKVGDLADLVVVDKDVAGGEVAVDYLWDEESMKGNIFSICHLFFASVCFILFCQKVAWI